MAAGKSEIALDNDTYYFDTKKAKPLEERVDVNLMKRLQTMLQGEQILKLALFHRAH